MGKKSCCNKTVAINHFGDGDGVLSSCLCFKNIARIANAVPFTLYLRVTVNNEIVVLNCYKCYQCLKCYKSLG